jgi:hypothetical protein
MANQDGEGPANGSTDARAHYIDPQKLMRDDTLSTAKKLALLKDWALEVDNLLQAAGEGMGASDPLKSQQEAALAEESARVQDALHALRSNTC